ncbi:hypothetical protein G9A89_016614 [Geosiphon pyriformis]|nr:hypothetical protein G9A89_016614 [Geosiphon pyriformis]
MGLQVGEDKLKQLLEMVLAKLAFRFSVVRELDTHLQSANLVALFFAFKGIAEEQAVNALRQFDNDIDRAIDYIFSPTNVDDRLALNKVDAPDPMNTDYPGWQTSTPRSESKLASFYVQYSYGILLIKSRTVILYKAQFNIPDGAPNNHSTIDLTQDNSEASIKDQQDVQMQQSLLKRLVDTTSHSTTTQDEGWGEIPLTVAKAAQLEDVDVSYKSSTQQNLPWPMISRYRTDPENPLHRTRLQYTPVGLRTPREHQFATCFIQAFFHIPLFRASVLSCRPTRENWGNVEGYWKGTACGLSNESDNFSQTFSQYGFRQSSYTLVHEMQKLFAFLLLSDRSYGDASYVIDAVNPQVKSTGWHATWLDFVGEFCKTLAGKLIQAINYSDLDHETSKIRPELIGYILSFEDYYPSPKLERVIISFEFIFQYYRDLIPRNKLYLDFYFNGRNNLEISSHNNLYEALDEILNKPTEKYFFSDLAKLLILRVIPKDLSDNIGYPYSDKSFKLDKEIYVDRYLEKNRDQVIDCCRMIEELTGKITTAKQAIESITQFEGNSNGPELLQSCIEYYQKKLEAIDPNDTQSIEQINRTINFLKTNKEQAEAKLNEYLAEIEDSQNRLATIYDIPELQQTLYRLRAVLIYDGEIGEGHYWAYVWVTGGETEEEPENGWWKFCDTTVTKVTEEEVFRDDVGTNINASIFALLYVNAEYDLAIPTKSLIPSSLREFVEADNAALQQEYQDYKEKLREAPPEYSAIDRPLKTDNEYAWDFDSNMRQDSSYSMDNNRKLDLIQEQVKNMRNINPMILERFEIFCAKIQRDDIVQSLIMNYLDPNRTVNEPSWDSPLPLDSRYKEDPKFQSIIMAFEQYANITQWLIKSLEEMNKDQYRMAFDFFLETLKLENLWLRNIQSPDEQGKIQVNDVESIKRAHYIIEYAKICLKGSCFRSLEDLGFKNLYVVLHQRALEKANAEASLSDAIKDALVVLWNLIRLVGPEDVKSDHLYTAISDEWLNFAEERDRAAPGDTQEDIRQLIDKFIDPETLVIQSSLLNDEQIALSPVLEDDNIPLHKRYEEALRNCQRSFGNELYNGDTFLD